MAFCSQTPVGVLAGRQALLEQREAAQHRHQQVVEIVRNAAGQLADGIHFLRLEQLRQRGFALARALFDAMFEFLVEALQLGGALRDALFQLGIEALQLARLAIQIDEHFHLGAQQLRHDRHGHVIDAAELVAAQLIRFGHHHRRDENDGGGLESRVLANHRRELEAVQIRHAHIDEDQGHFVLEQHLEGLARGGRLDEVLADLGQDDFVAQQLGVLIIDQQDIDLVRWLIGWSFGLSPQRCSHMRRAESNCSIFTGFAR